MADNTEPGIDENTCRPGPDALVVRDARASVRLVFRYLATQQFRLAALSFAVEALALRIFGWFGRPSCFWQHRYRFNQFRQSLKGRLAVFLLGPELLSLDNHDALLADAPVVEVQQTFLVKIR